MLKKAAPAWSSLFATLNHPEEERYGQFAHPSRRDHRSLATGRSPHLDIRSLLCPCPRLRRFRRVPELRHIPVRDLPAAWNFVDRLSLGQFAIALAFGIPDCRRFCFGRACCRDRSL